jgi:hypothetical protein
MVLEFNNGKGPAAKLGGFDCIIDVAACKP